MTCRQPILISVALLACSAITFAETLKLTLTEAVQLALRQNRALKIARLKVRENEQKKTVTRSEYFPAITNQSDLLHTTSVENIRLPAGALGTVPNAGPVPAHEIIIDQGNQTFVASRTTLVQPLTQLLRIRQANRIAASEVSASQDELTKAEIEVAVGVHELYYGVLIARLQKRAADEESVSATVHLRESEDDIRNGSALRIAAIESRAGLLQSQQNALATELRGADLTAELNDLLGLPLDTELELSAIDPASFVPSPAPDYTKSALVHNPAIRAAAAQVQQAEAGVAAARTSYIPDVSAFARQSYQNGVPFLVHNFGTFGINLSYEVFDFGKRRATVREREIRLAQAKENLERIKDSIAVQLERAANKVERTANMLRVAGELVTLRAEGERLAANQLAQGVVLVSARRQASAATYRAQADLLQAQLAYLLSRAELDKAAGRIPGL